MASMLTTAPVKSMLSSTSGMWRWFHCSSLPSPYPQCWWCAHRPMLMGMWVYESEDFDSRIRLPSIETSLPFKSLTSVLPKTDRHSAKAVGSIREITLSIVSTLGKPLDSSNNGLRDFPSVFTKLIHRYVIVSATEISRSLIYHSTCACNVPSH